MLRLYRTSADPRLYRGVIIVIACLILITSWRRLTFSSSYSMDGSATSNNKNALNTDSNEMDGSGGGLYSEPNPPETFVPANHCVGGKLIKPLEPKGNDGGVWCPEKGGGTRNLACSKTSTEYRFQVKKEGKYYLYIQTVAPTIMDNSLWVGRPDVMEDHDSKEYKTFHDCMSATTAGPLIPHKHVSTKKTFLCCPAYLAKNEKKNMNAFYSACVFSGLGPKGDEIGTVFDLELSEAPRWNQVPRVILVENPNKIISIRVYAREDGTQWTGLFLSKKSALTIDDLPS